MSSPKKSYTKSPTKVRPSTGVVSSGSPLKRGLTSQMTLTSIKIVEELNNTEIINQDKDIEIERL